MKLNIVAREAPTESDRETVLAALREHNVSQAGPANLRSFALMVQDQNGVSIGGAYGHTSYDWMFIQYLAIPKSHRGHGIGTRLIERAEDLARARSCIGVWLDTYAFQAVPFYEKLGYSMFGSIPDHPAGSARFFFSKRF